MEELDPGIKEYTLEGKWQPTPVFLLLRIIPWTQELVGCQQQSPWGERPGLNYSDQKHPLQTTKPSR